MLAYNHLTTDPACRLHIPPRTWWERRRFNKARGIPCYRCARGYTARANRAALQREVLLAELMQHLRDLQTSTEQGYAENPTIRNAWVVRGYRLAIADALRVLGGAGSSATFQSFRLNEEQ